MRDLEQKTSSFVGILFLSAVEISCSDELSMKTSFITSVGALALPRENLSL